MITPPPPPSPNAPWSLHFRTCTLQRPTKPSVDVRAKYWHEGYHEMEVRFFRTKHGRQSEPHRVVYPAQMKGKPEAQLQQHMLSCKESMQAVPCSSTGIESPMGHRSSWHCPAIKPLAMALHSSKLPLPTTVPAGAALLYPTGRQGSFASSPASHSTRLSDKLPTHRSNSIAKNVSFIIAVDQPKKMLTDIIAPIITGQLN